MKMVVRAFFSVVLIWLPFIVGAQSFPALHDVHRVAANDVLNVRAEPRAGTRKIGALAHDETDVEVIRVEQGWGLVNVGEVSGWTSMRYLKPQLTGDYALSRRLACYGTEPFWSLQISQGTRMVFERIDEEPQTFSAGLIQRSFNRTDRLSVQGQGSGSVAAVIGRRACNDGMSDREFGLDIDLLVDGTHLTGCCSLSGN